MVLNWESLVTEREGGDIRDKKLDVEQMTGRTIRDQDDGRQRAEEEHKWLTVKAAFFYARNGMVASTDPGWLQSDFDTLTGLFGRLGLQENVQKDHGGGVQTMSGIRGAGRRVLHPVDDRGRADLQGAAAGSGAMLGVQ